MAILDKNTHANTAVRILSIVKVVWPVQADKSRNPCLLPFIWKNVVELIVLHGN